MVVKKASSSRGDDETRPKKLKQTKDSSPSSPLIEPSPTMSPAENGDVLISDVPLDDVKLDDDEEPMAAVDSMISDNGTNVSHVE